MSQKKDAQSRLLSNAKHPPLGKSPFLTMARAVLKAISTADPIVSGSKSSPSNYEKLSIRFHRCGGSPTTTQPKRPSTLGLLPSLLRVPSRLLASPLLASRLLVRRLLAPRLLVPWSGCRYCEPVLKCLPGRRRINSSGSLDISRRLSRVRRDALLTSS
jgi:hypothetical protein